ncbi:hypothetical protein [Pedobacter sp.]
MEEKNIFGGFLSSTADSKWTEQEKNTAFQIGRNIRSFLWASGGFIEKIKKLEYPDYGNDLKIILFQFYVNPIPDLLKELQEIESYRKKEKSIGIPIVLNDENFLSMSEENRAAYLKSIVLRKMDILKKAIVRNGLDTRIELLKNDLEKVLS